MDSGFRYESDCCFWYFVVRKADASLHTPWKRKCKAGEYLAQIDLNSLTWDDTESHLYPDSDGRFSKLHEFIQAYVNKIEKTPGLLGSKAIPKIKLNDMDGKTPKTALWLPGESGEVLHAAVLVSLAP